MTTENITPPSDQQYPPPPPYAPPYQQQYRPPRRAMRSSSDKMVAGVCGGLGAYFGVDPTLVRVGAVVALVVGLPATLIAYLVAWAIMPLSA